MKKATILAAILAAGVSSATFAQTMDATTSTSGTATSGNSMGNTTGGAMNGAQAPADPTLAGPKRPNSSYGTQDPGMADTTPGVNQPTTTRNADSTETRAPLKGANSFTLGEATRRIQRAGYTNVTGLAKDDQSVWRGLATNKNGQAVAVALDYRGNITDQPKQ